MKIPKHDALTDDQLKELCSRGDHMLLAVAYRELREHHVLEAGELTRRLTRALYLANGYLAEIQGEDPSAYDYEQEFANLDQLIPPGAR